MENKISTHCFEVYKQNVPLHEGLLRTTCVDTSTIDEAIAQVQKSNEDKYDFKTFIVRK